MIRTIVESPFAGELERNIEYLKRCLKDCFERGEAPFASHAIYPQVLKDSDPKERDLGIRAGFAWTKTAQQCAVYQDYGISKGMQLGIKMANLTKIPVCYRLIGKNEVKPREET